MPLAPGELTDIFVRGAVAAGLLAAIQDRWTVGKPSGRKVMRLALQGGVALAAGAAGAEVCATGTISARWSRARSARWASQRPKRCSNPKHPHPPGETDIG